MEGEKQGVEGRSLAQLKEMLDRQEKLASNPKLLTKLPDKGHKVQQFLETLRHVVAEREKLETSPSQPHEQLPSTAPQSSTQKPQDRLLIEKQQHGASTEKQQNGVSTDKQQQGVLEEQEDDASISRGLFPRRSDQEHSIISQRLGVPTSGDSEVMDTAAGLSECLENLTVSELAAPRMSSGEGKVVLTPADGGNLETRFPNSYETVMKRSAEKKGKRVPFKPNSSLKVSTIDGLPDAYKMKSKGSPNTSAPETTADEEKSNKLTIHREQKAVEESAVQGPHYKFSRAKEISILDSISLQKQQRDHLEKLKSLHAAEKLAERLNIKTAVYDPPTVDMNYRSSDMTSDANVYDSDDAPDDVLP